ncbi:MULTISPECIES: aminoglycoside phosphotransferase [unclassified Streptomyces]|uniref:aminoglycoside phosphotransferase n=1 Tax=unclassified Streptomyces TaxID=2593676 RepID=UPI0016612481|nr:MULTISPECIES: aminoglycoside phosphotransferase [unclassified Streptomyces]MBD0707251.1 aminoglycoside phosphotransferase [Streptomyces sp. CBMA291]MBD0713739.1 aminoglycoside phosphotransferase [Streptomyces sp. CBMA370]
MSTGRIRWDQLPEALVKAVGERLGTAFTARDAEHSAAAGVAALLDLAAGAPDIGPGSSPSPASASASGTVFVKGQRDPAPAVGTASEEDGSWWGPGWSPVDELDLEEAVNPYLPKSAPRVLWRLDGYGWQLLAFEGVPGRGADFAPGSPDLAPVAAALAELAPLPAPPGVRLPTAWDRWGYYCAAADRGLLAGSRLLHTDPASTNILVEEGVRARLVDWSWATAGPVWIDTALWGMRLVSTGGHSPEQAWRWAARVPGWSAADPKAVATLVRAEARRWHDLAAERVPTADSIARSADEWAGFLAAREGD